MIKNSDVLKLMFYIKIIWFVQYLVHGEANCPTVQEWDSRALVKCSDPSLYHCLLNNEDQYTEICMEAVHIPKGSYPKLSRNTIIISRACPMDEYQPFGKLSNRYHRITCDFKKSTCNDAGEMPCDDGSPISDRLCECDYRNGYRNFLSNTCYRKSTTSTPCIYLPCKPGKELNPDFQCVDKCADGFFRPFKGHSCILNRTQTRTQKNMYVDGTFSTFQSGPHGIMKSITASTHKNLRIGELIDDNEPLIQTTEVSATSDKANLFANENVASSRLLPKFSPSMQSTISKNGCIREEIDEIKFGKNQDGLSIDSNDVIARIKDAAIVVLLVSLIIVSLTAWKQRYVRLKKVKEISCVYLSTEGYLGDLPQNEVDIYQTVNTRENDRKSLSSASRNSPERPLEYVDPSVMDLNPPDKEMDTKDKDSEYVQMNRIVPDLNRVKYF